MDRAERQRAKAHLVSNMVQGQSWAAYRLAQLARTEGAAALEDRPATPPNLAGPYSRG